jgi:hypothetical protein
MAAERGNYSAGVEDGFSRAAWAPDSTRFAFATTKTRYYANRRALDGKVNTVYSRPYLSLEWAVPSPNGRHLAIVQNSNKSNISLVEGF